MTELDVTLWGGDRAPLLAVVAFAVDSLLLLLLLRVFKSLVATLLLGLLLLLVALLLLFSFLRGLLGGLCLPAHLAYYPLPSTLPSSSSTLYPTLFFFYPLLVLPSS